LEAEEHEPAVDLDRKAFGILVRNARHACGLSQAALARAVKISPVFVSQIETGQRIPSDRVAKNMALTLGLPWQDVLRTVYMLRSHEAGELFLQSGVSGESASWSLSQIPAIRFLLMQLAGLDLSQRDIEALVQNWSNDVRFLKEQLARAQGR
jgi:transcriptional regulator with XRE-family HTH domain